MTFRLESADETGYVFVYVGRDSNIWGAAYVWCTEQFGRQTPPEPMRWRLGNYRFYFPGEAEATHFRLRWC